MDTEKCIFCKIVDGSIPAEKIYEDDNVVAFLDIAPISDGHTLVITKRHFDKFHECPGELASKIFSKLGMIAQAVCDTIESDGYNVLCNNGRAAGQLVEHIHFHIIPRNEGDGIFNRWPSYSYPAGKAEKIAELIRKKL